MKISCPACSAKYSIADDKVQDRLAKIRCRKCGATIVIDGKANPPSVYTSAGDAADVAESDTAGTEFSVDFGEGDQRTLPLRDLVTAYNSGQVTGETFVWAEGFADWKPLADVPEIVEALNAGAAAPAATSPWDKPAAARAAAASKASAPRVAARTSGGRSATADLFGGIDSAGSEDEVATSAPDQPPTLGTPSGASSSSSTGARNESSVLFSLSALTSAAQTQTTKAPATRSSANGSASRDDSGLIDLKALTAAAIKNEATGAPPAVAAAMPMMSQMSPLGVAQPLGFGSPFGNPSGGGVDLGGMPQMKSKAPIYIGAGLAVGLLAIAAAILLKPEPPPPPPAPVIVQAPPPPAPVATTPPEPIAKPPATGTPEETETKPGTTAQKRRPSGGGGGVKKPGASPGGASDSPAAAKPAAPKGGNCGCAASDLMCNMKCSSK